MGQRGRQGGALRGGSHLGSLAGRDLARRCGQGRLDARAAAQSRRERKQKLTGECTSRWAGAITRTSADAWEAAERNLAAEARSLRARTGRIRRRLAVPGRRATGRPRPRVREPGRNAGRSSSGCSVSRPGWPRWTPAWTRDACRSSGAGGALPRPATAWQPPVRTRSAGGIAGGPGGGSSPRTGRPARTGEIRQSAGTLARAGWRSGCPPRSLTWRTGRTAATGYPPRCRSPTGARRQPPRQPAGRSVTTSAATRARTDGISTPPGPSRSPGVAALDELRQSPVLAVDLNDGHLAAWVLDTSGNPLGEPITAGLDLGGLQPYPPGTVTCGRRSPR